jgi:DNA-binding CsgD family transcriptional regulator/tetratricopeptide (TPR) repeat protein
VADESGYAFRHTLMRDAVYADMLPGERTGLHRAYADTLERDPSLAGGEGAAAASLAHHSYAAHDLPLALAAAVNAARHATSSYAPADAERHLERALEVWPQVPDAEQRAGMDRLGLMELTIDAAIAAGDEGRALALVDDALPTVDREAEPRRAAVLLARRADALRWLGRGDGMAELEEVAALLPAEPATPELAEVFVLLASAKMLTADLAGAVEAARRGVEAARAVGDVRGEASALIALGSSTGYLGEVDEGLALLRQALEVASRAGDDAGAVRAYTNVADTLELSGRHAEAAEVAREGLAFAQRVGLAGRWGIYLGVNLAEPLVALGRWEEAREVLSEIAETNPPSARALPIYQLAARVALARGQADESARILDTVLSMAGAELDFQTAATQALVRAEHAIATRDLDTAREAVRHALVDQSAEQDGRMGWPLVWLGMRVEADRAAVARDRREPPDPDGVAWAQELAEIAGRLPEVGDTMKAHAALVAAERTRLADDPGLDAWRSAEAACRAAGTPELLAYALLRVAEAELARDDRAAAAEAVREAATVAERIGAKPLADEAASLAQRARLTVEEKPAAASDDESDELPFGLTERELEVLRLIAAGHTNRQIGDTLYMSPKTASVHVSRILAKLGVAGRVEAAAVAHRLGLSEPVG